ncbi:hypothetical protein BC939DRAFT_444622 [Gamsiella multidivaricata]|uniref:uncharacterized protein n=1 Tax=Gamsiella multidivaricata TaxID=101098 RepID=UPI00221ED129|nr:uncharacterized protein BC939DRAFT_444622 [Gamsiella multidivaricata]KAG0367001.1 hypothetical protein BGZ54_004566 [Gamsiella multidivaricata]KAI7827554.1 hypothetical protein BC939DRAFT_444622 [Gamsiella multidivaricata]
MDFVTYQFDSPAQFYAELKDVLDGGGFYDSPESQVGVFISLIVLYQDEFLDGSGQDLAQCCYRLFDSNVFQRYMEIITRSIIDRAIQSPEDKDMWITYQVLIYAGKEFPKVFHWMLKSEFFAKLKYQILKQEGTRMQPLAVNIMYEMCRVQQLKECDLALVDEVFLHYLLDLVERTRTDETETLNYSAIKLLLVFNEQFMLYMSDRSHYTQVGNKPAYTGNPLLTVLTDRPGLSCTFGENLIFILNRAEETALQMLILKLLYLLFTNPNLYEFFYTNDLHVLVDVVIRELWDLPKEEESLRHAYLRVMGPLLTNTQLKRATYKRAEIFRLLRDLGGGDMDSTLRRQLYEQQLKEDLLEQERAQHAKVTYRDRLSSSSSTGSNTSLARWASDRSGCSSPVLSFEVEHRKRQLGHSKLSNDSSSSSLKVPGQEEAEERARYHLSQQQLSQSPTQEESALIKIEQPEPERKEPQPRATSPTTLRLVERVLREWLDNEMRNGAGTTGAGLSVRGITDR